MTDIDKLTKRMDDCVETLNEHWPASATVMVEAADTIAAQQKRIEELEKSLTEACDDLEADLEQTYPEANREHPSEKRRYERDLGIINGYRKTLNGGSDNG